MSDCGCGGGGGIPVAQSWQPPQVEFQGDCPYTYITLMDYYTKLNGVKANGQVALIGITEAKLNSYIGFVISALNTNTNYCFFKQQLDEVSLIIPSINAL